ncbi:MAG: undecaprenyl-diphosphate phosphatase [Bdellovibrionota bacterium]
MSIVHIFILALIQGAAELLPVSSSAHVIVAERLLGLDPSSPQMTFLLVMLHTGTMFAVLAYFWPRWRKLLAGGRATGFLKMIVIATACTGVLGFGLKKVIEKVILEGMLGHAHGEVESLFRFLPLIAVSLAAAGALILYSGTHEKKARKTTLTERQSGIIGVVQGLCLPFRGFSRSGATISSGLLLGIDRAFAESFSFALAVVLTPPVIALELHRLLKSTGQPFLQNPELASVLMPGLLGMVFSFASGILALKWLSAWLEAGKWKLFGYYCLAASCGVALVHLGGY